MGIESPSPNVAAHVDGFVDVAARAVQHDDLCPFAHLQIELAQVFGRGMVNAAMRQNGRAGHSDSTSVNCMRVCDSGPWGVGPNGLSGVVCGVPTRVDTRSTSSTLPALWRDSV